MYYAMRASAPSLHRESTDSLIHIYSYNVYSYNVCILCVYGRIYCVHLAHTN